MNESLFTQLLNVTVGAMLLCAVIILWRRELAAIISVFLVQGLATLAVVGLVRPDPRMVAALVIGTGVGMWLAPRIPMGAARHALLVVAAFGGAALILGNV